MRLLLPVVALGPALALSQTTEPPYIEPDYRAPVYQYVPLPLAGKRPDFSDRIERGPLRRFSEETAVLAHLWQWSGRPEYAEATRQRLTALVDVWQVQRAPGRAWKRICFFSAHPIMDAYGVLVAGGQLDGDFQKRFRQFAQEAYFPLEQGAFNQAFARVAGLALAAKTLPDLREAPSWRRESEKIWDDWFHQRDTTENAACYNGISLTFLFILGDALDRTERFQDPAVRRMFERFRDQISPLGVVPEYGDSGDADWAMFHCWGNWVAALERAAHVYHDPAYRWAAVRLFQAACRHSAARPPDQRLDAMNTAYALCLADQWRDRQIRPQPSRATSAVAYRREPGNDHAVDKILLASSRQPGVPFVMVELFARSYHAHEDQLGAVLYYEAGDVPLLHGLGYHNRAAEQANLLMMCPTGESFPHKPQPFTAGIWYEASLPARRMPPLATTGEGRDLRHFDKLTFRVAEDGPTDLFLANLRLKGPKGELVLDQFRKQRVWRGGRQALVPGPTSDQQALRVSSQRGTSFIWRQGFNTTFSLHDYDRFEFSWMMQGAEPGWSKSLIFRVDGSPTDFHVPLRPQAAEILRARVDARDGDQFGEYEAAGWFTSDSRLVRRMLLLAEGPLVVCDELRPGRKAEGWVAGPLWHLTSVPQEGGNWFDAPGPRSLLVWLSPAPGRTLGMQTTQLWSGVRPFTVFAKQTLKADQPVRFVSLLVPHEASTRADQLVRGIRLSESASGDVEVDVPTPSGSVRAGIGRQGDWTVRRTK